MEVLELCKNAVVDTSAVAANDLDDLIKELNIFVSFDPGVRTTTAENTVGVDELPETYDDASPRQLLELNPFKDPLNKESHEFIQVLNNQESNDLFNEFFPNGRTPSPSNQDQDPDYQLSDDLSSESTSSSASSATEEDVDYSDFAAFLNKDGDSQESKFQESQFQDLLEEHARVMEASSYTVVGTEDRDDILPQNTVPGNASEHKKPQFFCDICQRSFTRRGAVAYHICVCHTTVKGGLHKCKTCFEVFRTFRQKLLHEKTHVRLTCTICFKLLDHNVGQRKHNEQFHKGPKRYKCKYCENEYSKAFNRDRHMNFMHSDESSDKQQISTVRRTGTWFNMCPVPTCRKILSVKTSMPKHLQTHNVGVQNDFKCHFCKKSFSSPANRKRHEQSLHINGVNVPTKQALDKNRMGTASSGLPRRQTRLQVKKDSQINNMSMKTLLQTFCLCEDGTCEEGRCKNITSLPSIIGSGSKLQHVPQKQAKPVEREKSATQEQASTAHSNLMKLCSSSNLVLECRIVCRKLSSEASLPDQLAVVEPDKTALPDGCVVSLRNREVRRPQKAVGSENKNRKPRTMENTLSMVSESLKELEVKCARVDVLHATSTSECKLLEGSDNSAVFGTHMDKVKSFVSDKTLPTEYVPLSLPQSLTDCKVVIEKLATGPSQSFPRGNSLPSPLLSFAQDSITKGILHNTRSTKNLLTPMVDCDICFKPFISDSSLERHMKYAHAPPKKYPCHLCDESFTALHFLSVHKHKAHPIKCEVCYKGFLSSTSLKDHMKLQHQEIKFLYKCSICDKAFTLLNSLKEHEEQNHSQLQVAHRCQECGKVFTRARTLKNHILIHSAGSNTFQCDDCGKRFSFVRYLHRHVKIHHPSSVVLQQKLCTTCGKCFSSLTGYTKHLTSKNHKINALCPKCEICNKLFARKSTLALHMKSHSRPKEVNKCKLCGKVFVYKRSFDRHLIQKHKPKTYPCVPCGKVFSTESLLESHTYTTNHCSICKPIVTFKRVRDFEAHKRSHM